MPWTFPYLGETEELNVTTRAHAPGDFAHLSDGFTHYELDGPENGEVVVLVHGFSVPFFIWEPTFAFLAKSEFRVLRYDLIGRGYSDKPKLSYNIDLFCKQLRELLDKLGFDKISLMGLSMGGAISASFTARYPERVKRLVLLDPSGVKPIQLPRMRKAIFLPGIGELAFSLFGNDMLLKGIAEDLYGPDLVEIFQDRFRVQLKYRGFKQAILSTLRNNILGDFSSTYRKIGALDIPTLLFWGVDDKTIPFAHSDAIRATIPQVQFIAVENCGHIPHYEKPEIVNPILKKFLQ